MKINSLIQKLRNDFGITLHQAERYQELFNQAVDSRIKEEYSCRNCKYKEYYQKNATKKVDCMACNGSGYYDNDGSPPCGACNGTGKEEVSLEEYKSRKENGLL